jgi:GNAT superfamily N-acetyltransferase
MSEIIIREAVGGEIPALLQFWQDKSRRLEARGIKVWDPAEFNQEGLRAKYGDPRFFLGTAGGVIFGAFILIERDPYYWGDDDSPAFYLHKLAVADAFAGRGLAAAMLEWVKDHGRRHGKTSIRLDYNEDRAYLKKLYLGNGFATVRQFEKNARHTMVLAECPLG